jgi:predicted metal-dependent hydrolase
MNLFNVTCTIPPRKQNEATIAFLQKNMNLLKPTCTVPPLRKNEATAAFIENKHELTQTDLHCAAFQRKMKQLLYTCSVIESLLHFVPVAFAKNLKPSKIDDAHQSSRIQGRESTP